MGFYPAIYYWDMNFIPFSGSCIRSYLVDQANISPLRGHIPARVLNMLSHTTHDLKTYSIIIEIPVVLETMAIRYLG